MNNDHFIWCWNCVKLMNAWLANRGFYVGCLLLLVWLCYNMIHKQIKGSNRILIDRADWNEQERESKNEIKSNLKHLLQIRITQCTSSQKKKYKQITKSPAEYKRNAILRYKLISIPLNANEMLASYHFSYSMFRFYIAIFWSIYYRL